MLTRAIITNTDLAHGKVQVRIPWLEGVYNSGVAPMADNNLMWASIIYIPGINVEYKQDDVVIVGFENNDVGMPIVLGFLKLSSGEIDSRVYSTMKELTVEDKFTSPDNTIIGRTEYSEIFTAYNKSEGQTSTGGVDDGILLQ